MPVQVQIDKNTVATCPPEVSAQGPEAEQAWLESQAAKSSKAFLREEGKSRGRPAPPAAPAAAPTSATRKPAVTVQESARAAPAPDAPASSTTAGNTGGDQ